MRLLRARSSTSPAWPPLLQARAKYSSPTAQFSLTTENVGITLGGTLGTITLSMTAEATGALSFVRAVYDLQIVPPVGRE